MTSYILNDNDSVGIANRSLKIKVSGGTPGEILLATQCGTEVVLNTGGNPGSMTVEKVGEPFEIRVRPLKDQSLFPDGTIVNLEVRTERTADEDADVAMICDVEVSGWAFRNLLRVEVDECADTLKVTALDVPVDPTVGSLAKKARAAARGHLGIHRIADAVHVLVAVDMSVSMRTAIDDGSVAAALEIITGLSQVIDSDRTPEVFLLGGEFTKLPATEIQEVGSEAVRAITQRRHRLGCGFQVLPPELSTPENSITYVITDAVPPLASGTPVNGSGRAIRHVFLVGADQDRSEVMPVSMLPRVGGRERGGAGERVDPQVHLLDDYDALSALVVSLLAGVTRDGVEFDR